MTTLEIKKREFIKDIDSEETLNKLRQYLKKLKKNTPPCQYTIQELKERLNQGVIDAKNGKGTPLAEIRKKYGRV